MKAFIEWENGVVRVVNNDTDEKDIFAGYIENLAGHTVTVRTAGGADIRLAPSGSRGSWRGFRNTPADLCVFKEICTAGGILTVEEDTADRELLE